MTSSVSEEEEIGVLSWQQLRLYHSKAASPVNRFHMQRKSVPWTRSDRPVYQRQEHAIVFRLQSTPNSWYTCTSWGYPTQVNAYVKLEFKPHVIKNYLNDLYVPVIIL